jgi:hypothetical protein
MWTFFKISIFGLSPEQASFTRRRFRGGSGGMRQRLETAGGAFVKGYNLALKHGRPGVAIEDLNSIEPELRGFAFEGAAMAFALLDWMTPWRRDRMREFISGVGSSHIYMLHVGVGWVWARLPINLRTAKARLDPLLGWLAFDGWGFHEGFFHWPKYISGGPAPQKLKGFERRVFDQGLGRSFWFVNGGDVELIARTIQDFSPDRRGDLWSGIGLAATYAGMITDASLARLVELAGSFQPQLAQGSAFAAKARQRAGNLTDYTSRATGVLCGLAAGDAARLTDEVLENLPADAGLPAYAIWRNRVQNHWSQKPEFQEA